MTNQKKKPDLYGWNKAIQEIASPRCPNCGWTSRVEYLRRTKTFKCTHCSHEWKKEG